MILRIDLSSCPDPKKFLANLPAGAKVSDKGIEIDDNKNKQEIISLIFDKLHQESRFPLRGVRDFGQQ